MTDIKAAHDKLTVLVGALYLAMDANGLTPIGQYNQDDPDQVSVSTLIDGFKAQVSYNGNGLFAVVFGGKADFGTELDKVLASARSRRVKPLLSFQYALNDLLRKYQATIAVNVVSEAHGLYDLELIMEVGDEPVHTEIVESVRVLKISADN